MMSNYSSSRKIYAFGSLILGILLLVWPSSALKLAAYTVGIVVMAGGITSILSYMRRKRQTGGIGGGLNLIVGIIVTVAGGMILFNPKDFAAIIPTVLGYLITLSGVINLLETFTLSRAHYRKWWVSLLAAVLTIVLGLILVNHAFGIALTMTRIGGIALLFNGVSDLWITRRVDQYSKSARKGSKRKKTGRNAAAGSGGSARFDTSDPDIIDAEDYHEL
jgi:uncharacterized membrane protein HdeD (DUF308 family)